MTTNILPVITLTQPPEQFATVEEANSYLRDLHRDLEAQFSNIESSLVSSASPSSGTGGSGSGASYIGGRRSTGSSILDAGRRTT